MELDVTVNCITQLNQRVMNDEQLAEQHTPD
jgi:hypothetical protein